jgi:S1-C subfamily serine protease
MLLSAPAQARDSDPDLTAMVHTVAQEAWPPGKVPSGSGFFVSADGDVVTASHVIAGCGHVSIRDGARKMSASIVGADSHIDAALLHARVGGHAFLTLARANTAPDVELTLLTRSWPRGSALSVAVRSLGQFDGHAHDGLLKLSGRVEPGASGAAIVNSRGEVDGYLIGRMADRHDVALGMPADDLRGFLGYFTGTRDALREVDDAGLAPSAKLGDAAVAVACVR